ncbi:hypothetical protein OG548_03690 [Streptomyces sp. NBC_01356]|uniref:hypothetical protein n=1 Tax=Streptomyces sp. NBC_01356 TaxID=2903836 RepID=UPI002E3559BA|nr:hypothetical protein [Streptomyces sp. NBC_01356]
MAEIPPHITVAHHDQYGVSDIARQPHRRSHAAADRLRAAARRPPVRPARASARSDTARTAGRQSLRAAQCSVTSDAAYDLKPTTRLHGDRGLLNRPDNSPAAESLGGEGTVFTSARVLDADIRASRIAVHDQVRDPEGTLRAVGTDMRTCEGVLLHGEGDLRYVESRLDSTSLAFDAFSYIRGNGRPDPTPSTQQRQAQASVAISPAHAGASVPRRPDVAVAHHPAATAQQPVRVR